MILESKFDRWQKKKPSPTESENSSRSSTEVSIYDHFSNVDDILVNYMLISHSLTIILVQCAFFYLNVVYQVAAFGTIYLHKYMYFSRSCQGISTAI